MFCPKCASQNLDGASFCRGCGANISLVPQALTGEIARPKTEEVAEGACSTGRPQQLTLDQVFKNIFLGIAFLLIAIVLSRSGMGQGWWFWMLLPAFSLMGIGVGQLIRLRERDKQALPGAPSARTFPDRFKAEMPARPTDELMAPVPSVTEGTTRHLGVEAPTRHLDASERK